MFSSKSFMVSDFTFKTLIHYFIVFSNEIFISYIFYMSEEQNCDLSLLVIKVLKDSFLECSSYLLKISISFLWGLNVQKSSLTYYDHYLL